MILLRARMWLNDSPFNVIVHRVLDGESLAAQVATEDLLEMNARVLSQQLCGSERLSANLAHLVLVLVGVFSVAPVEIRFSV